MLETVIAVGLFAGTVTVLLGLLPGLIRNAADASDAVAAQGLADGIRVELERLVASQGLDAVAAQVAPDNLRSQPTLRLAAARDGSRIRPWPEGVEAGRAPGDAGYFLIELRRYTSPPLAFEPGAPVLAVRVRLTWPCPAPGTAPGTLPPGGDVGFALAVVR
ncbi:MAG: hypothetical protein JNG83_06760 [Opitutaceae bacterium]|nr:hypothetical protein [Opitutaceae bacterium]